LVLKQSNPWRRDWREDSLTQVWKKGGAQKILFITTASIKPSAQSRLVIEAVTMEAKQAEARWEKMMLAIEKLTGKVDAMEEERTLFRKQMEETGKAVSLLRVEAMARDMDRYGNEEAGERDNKNSQNRGERMHRGREGSSG
jgi:hypothetical protein